MKKTIYTKALAFFLFFFMLEIVAQIAEATDFPVISVNNLGTSQLGIKNQNFPFGPEITPLTLMQPNGQRLYSITTSWSFFMCLS